MKWGRRFRRRLRRAFRGESTSWNPTPYFTRNQDVLVVQIVVNRELLADDDRSALAREVGRLARTMAREAVERYHETRNIPVLHA